MSTASNNRFNAEAAAWDSNPDVISASTSALEALLNKFPQLKNTSGKGTTAANGLDILEIGCGTGLLSFLVAPYAHSVVAVDAASGMIDALKQKLKAPNAPKNITPLNILLVDPEDSQLPPSVDGDDTQPRKKFDLIISHLVLHHIPELEPLLHTMHGCLKPGGSIALTDFEDFGPKARLFHPEAKMDGVERHGIHKGDFEALIAKEGFLNANCEVAWVMKKHVERFPGQWGQQKPKEDELDGGLAEMDFPFLLCTGQKADKGS